MAKEKKLSDRQILNRVAKDINERSPASMLIEVQGRGPGQYQIVLQGLLMNLCFMGDFKECSGYLWGIRDTVAIHAK